MATGYVTTSAASTATDEDVMKLQINNRNVQAAGAVITSSFYFTLLALSNMQVKSKIRISVQKCKYQSSKLLITFRVSAVIMQHRCTTGTVYHGCHYMYKVVFM